MKPIVKCKNNDFIVECCKCHKIQTENGWSHVTKDSKKLVSHTYCDSCFQVACDQLERLISSN